MRGRRGDVRTPQSPIIIRSQRNTPEAGLEPGSPTNSPQTPLAGIVHDVPHMRWGGIPLGGGLVVITGLVTRWHQSCNYICIASISWRQTDPWDRASCKSPNVVLLEPSVFGQSDWTYQSNCLLPCSDPIGIFKLIV